jgi:hypothetical protein
MITSMSKNPDGFFSCFGFGEVADLDELKGAARRPSGLMITSMSKNPDGFFSCFGSDDPQHKEEVF